MLKSGDKLTLTSTPVYKNSVVKEPQIELNGDFYVTNGMIVNGRVKVSEDPNTTEYVGWIVVPTEEEITVEEVAEEVKTLEEMIAEPKFEEYKVKTSDTNRLNVRKTPSLEAAIVTVVAPKTTLTVCDEQDGWGRIEEFPGWICLKFVTRV